MTNRGYCFVSILRNLGVRLTKKLTTVEVSDLQKVKQIKRQLMWCNEVADFILESCNLTSAQKTACEYLLSHSFKEASDYFGISRQTISARMRNADAKIESKISRDVFTYIAEYDMDSYTACMGKYTSQLSLLFPADVLDILPTPAFCLGFSIKSAVKELLFLKRCTVPYLQSVLRQEDVSVVENVSSLGVDDTSGSDFLNVSYIQHILYVLGNLDLVNSSLDCNTIYRFFGVKRLKEK